MTRQDLLLLYDDNAWANARARGAVDPLTPEQFLRDRGNSFPSVRDTLAHILGAEWIWRRRRPGEVPSALPLAAEFPLPASLRDRFAAIQRGRRGFLEGLAEDRLNQPLNSRDTEGRPAALLPVHGLHHVVNHGTSHRGQIATMLRQLGAKPVSTDMSRFHLERAGAAG